MSNIALKDYYKILRVDRDASEADIRKSFRNLALQLHPDRNKDADAHNTFIEVNEAYQILSDPNKRAKYNLLYKKKKASGKGNLEDVVEWAEQGRGVGRKYADYTFTDFARDSYINWGTNVLLEDIFDGLGNIIEAAGDALGDMLDAD